MSLVLSLAVSLAVLTQTPAEPMKPRFEPRAPLPSVPPVMMDALINDYGEAQRIARQRNLQARILWVDATANIERFNTEDKIVGLVRRIKETGFNTIVFDVKPISGHVVYPSKLAPKLVTFRDRVLPEDFDPLAIMVREAKANSMPLYLSLNAFSEGHRMFLTGPGYEKLAQQTILYEIQPFFEANQQRIPLTPTLNTVRDGAVGIYTASDRVPPAQTTAFAVTLTKQNRVVDGFEWGGVGQSVPTVPRGGVIVYGTGTAADWLRQNALPGTTVGFVTEPLFIPISERPEQQLPLMMNPHDPQVQQYALDVVRELARNYDVDGIVYDDRLRYGGMNADFSPQARAAFEKRLGRPVKWPDDAFRFTIGPNLVKGIQPGRYYDEWMSFRADTLREFVQKARDAVQKERPGTQLGVYAGSWYGEYQSLGNNWASPEAEAGFWFLTPQYRKTGYAPLIDFLITGAYYPTATIHEAMSKGRPIGATVEAAGYLTNRLVRDTTWSYAGIALSDFKDDPEGLLNALQAACGSSQGVMVFDLSHDIEPMWPVFARAFATPRIAPHRDRASLADARRARERADAEGRKDPPIIIAAGSAGTGQ